MTPSRDGADHHTLTPLLPIRIPQGGVRGHGPLSFLSYYECHIGTMLKPAQKDTEFAMQSMAILRSPSSGRAGPCPQEEGGGHKTDHLVPRLQHTVDEACHLSQNQEVRQSALPGARGLLCHFTSP